MFQSNYKVLLASLARQLVQGLSKALSRKSTVIAMYLLDFILPQVAKLSKCLQTEKLNFTAISSLVDSTLLTLDDALLPAAN